MLRLVEPPLAPEPEAQPFAEPAAPGANWLLKLTRRVVGAKGLREICDGVDPSVSPFEFARRLLERLEIRWDLDEAGRARIPRAGRVLFVANHPLGPLDELIAVAVLGAVRSDLRVLSGFELLTVPELAPLAFGASGGAHSAGRGNAHALRQAVRWLAAERAVLTFPAGDTAHYDRRARCVTDPPWNPATGRLVQLTDSQVVPLHLAGASGRLFPIVGTLAPRLRRLFGPRELQRQRGIRVEVQVGAPIEAARLVRFRDNEAVAVHLRLKTLLTTARPPVAAATAPRELPPIAVEMPRAALIAELAALPASSLLLHHGDFEVRVADSARIPQLLSEIGRLREIALRTGGGGTGRPRALDRFDRACEHVFVWHRAVGRLVAGCRIGRIDAIRDHGLHSATRFHFRSPALCLLGAALELDRLFVRDGEENDPAALTLLWKGVGEICAREPRYCRVLGVTSVGQDYSGTSRDLLVGYLRGQRVDPLMSRLVSPHRPIARSRALGALITELGLLSNAEPLGTLIEDIEPDGKGIPPALGQYLRLGARVLGLGADETGAAIECLLMTDLRHAKPKELRRLMSGEGLARFAAAHRMRLTPRLSSNRMPSGAPD